MLYILQIVVLIFENSRYTPAYENIEQIYSKANICRLFADFFFVVGHVVADTIASLCGNGNQARFTGLFVCADDFSADAENFQRTFADCGFCGCFVCV